jgi:hypothetical protein
MSGPDPLRDIRDVPIDQYRAGLGEYLGAVMDDAWAQGPSMGLDRLYTTALAQRDARQAGETLLSPDEANEQAKEIGLRFEKPISRGAFDILADAKRAEIASETTFKRARAEEGYGTTRWLLAGGAEFIASAADPLNIASAFIPVVGEARYAAMAARIGTVPATLARGAIEGVAGQAVLEPVLAADRSLLDPDWTMLSAFVDLAFGGALGATLHGAGGGLHWLVTRGRARVDVPVPGARPVVSVEKLDGEPGPQSVAQAVETTHPRTREAALRAAVTQLAQDRPVDVEPVLAADPAWRSRQAQSREPDLATATDLQELGDRLSGELRGLLPRSAVVPADFQPDAKTFAEAKRLVRGWDPEKELPRPLTLGQFVTKSGGLLADTPEFAELRAANIDMGGTRPRQADQMAQAALEAGYRFVKETEAGSGIDVDGFIKALIDSEFDRGRGGTGLLPQGVDIEAWRHQQEYFAQYRRWLQEELQWDPRGRSAREVAWFLSRDGETQRLMALAERVEGLDDRTSLEVIARLDQELAAAEQATLDRLATEADLMRQGYEPELEGPRVDGEAGAPITAAEWEALHAELGRLDERTDEPGQGPAAADDARRAPGAGADAADRGSAGDDPAAAAGLRRSQEQGATRTEGTDGDLNGPGDLAAWAERQRTADVSADGRALDDLEGRLAIEQADVTAALADDLQRFQGLIDDDTRAAIDLIGRAWDEERAGTQSLGQCLVGAAA